MKIRIICVLILFTACAMKNEREIKSTNVRLKESVLSFPNSDKIQKTIYEYDSSGRLLEKKVEAYVKDKLSSSARTVYKYDDKGLHAEEENMSTDGSMKMTRKITYNAAGKELEVVSYDFDGYEYYRITYKYNQKGNLIEECHFSGTGDETSTVYTYNSAGILISDETRQIGHNTLLSKTVYKCDKNGRVLEKVTLIQTLENGAGTKNTYKYNDKGYLEKEEYYNIEGKNEKLSYTVRYTYYFY